MAKLRNKKSKKIAESLKCTKRPTNPFEVHFNRQKFHVLGRKLRNDHGLPGVARSKSIKKRKETLLQEYKVKDKSNRFVDRRIGEKNSAMTAEDRIMARFTAEKVKSHIKKAMFNLAEDEVLTHHGQTLSEIEQFEDPRSDDEADEEQEGKGGLDANFVEEAHFGGGMLRRSEQPRAAIIDQLIAESKQRKAEKQKSKEVTLELTERLDAGWKDLLPLLNPNRPKGDEDQARPKKEAYDMLMRELKFERRGVPSERLKSEDEIAKEEKERLEKLEAERVWRMKGLEPGDKPSQAMHRSADDLDDGFALESNAEEETLVYSAEGLPIGGKTFQFGDGRLVRMNRTTHETKGEGSASDSNSEGEEAASDDVAEVKGAASDGDAEAEGSASDGDAEADRSTSDGDDEEEEKLSCISEEQDDLSDLKSESDLVDSDEEIKGEVHEEVNSESDSSIKRKAKKAKLSGMRSNRTEKQIATQSDGTNTNLELILLNGPIEERQHKEMNSSEKAKGKKQVSFQLSKVEELCSLKVEAKQKPCLKAATESQLGVNVNRIRAELSEKKRLMEEARKELPFTFQIPETYEGLQTVMGGRPTDQQAVIVERMVKCTHPSLAPNNRDRLSTLFKFLMQLINDAGHNECWALLDRLAPLLFDLTQFAPENAAHCLSEVLTEKQAEFERHPTKFPKTDTLVFLKLVPLLFPVSDARHRITTPAAIFLCQMLQQSKAQTRRTIATGLFIVTLLLEYSNLSHRYCPQAVNFLHGLLNMATRLPANVIGSMPFKPEHKFLFLSHQVHLDLKETRMLKSDLASNSVPIDDDFRVRSLFATVRLLRRLADQYDSLSAAPVIFAPIEKSLSELEMELYPLLMRQEVETLISTLNQVTNKKLNFLTMEKKRPRALRLYEPKIQEVFDRKRRRVMSEERAEHEKLIHKYKKEMKGAVREVRRDRLFLAKVKFREQAAADAERMHKVKQIYSWGANQAGELRQMKRKKQ